MGACAGGRSGTLAARKPKHGKTQCPSVIFRERRNPLNNDDSKNFIQGAIKHPGALTAQAKQAGMSPMAFAREHQGDSGVTGKRSRLALTLRGLAGKRKKS